MKVRLAVFLSLAVGLLAMAVIPSFTEAATPRPVLLADELELQNPDGSEAASQIGMPEPELKQVTQGKGKWINGPKVGQVEPYTLHGPKAPCSIMIIGPPGDAVEYHVVKVTPLGGGRNRYTVAPL